MIAALDKRLPKEITNEIISYLKAEYIAEIKSIDVNYEDDGKDYDAYKTTEFKGQLINEAYCVTCGKKKYAEMPVHSRWESVHYADQIHHSYCEVEEVRNIDVDRFRGWTWLYWQGKLE